MGIKDVKMRVIKWERESDMIIENKNNGEREREREREIKDDICYKYKSSH